MVVVITTLVAVVVVYTVGQCHKLKQKDEPCGNKKKIEMKKN